MTEKNFCQLKEKIRKSVAIFASGSFKIETSKSFEVWSVNRLCLKLTKGFLCEISKKYISTVQLNNDDVFNRLKDHRIFWLIF